MIRVLHIGVSDTLGGIETFVINLYRNINRNQIQFDFVDFSQNGICFADEIKSLGGKIYKVCPRRKNIIKNKNELSSIIKKYNIIHYHTNTLSYSLPIRLAQRNNKQIIVHSHNDWKEKKYISKLLHYLNYYTLGAKNETQFACSDLSARWLFGSKNNAIMINNSIDTKKYIYNPEVRNSIRKELALEESLIMGTVGRFSYQKNHNFLLKIFKAVYEMDESAVLLLIGDGPLKEEIEKKARELGIYNKIYFLGIKNNVNDYLQAMDVFLLPSFYEGLPIVVVEAQAAGLKSFISDKITRQIDITSLVNYMPIDKPEEWAKEIIRQREYNRENTYNNIYNACFDIESLCDKLQNKYEEINHKYMEGLND